MSAPRIVGDYCTNMYNSIKNMIRKYLPLLSFILLWFLHQDIVPGYGETFQGSDLLDIQSGTEPLINISRDNSDLKILIEQLSNSDPDERVKALRALGGKGDPRATEPILGALKDRKTAVRDAAFAALNELVESLKTKQDVKALSMILRYPDKIIRQTAISALGSIPSSQSAEILVAELADSDSRIREEALKSLKTIGRPSVEPLIQSLKSDDISVRINSVMLLGEIAEKRAVEPLTEMLTFHSDDLAVDSIRLRLESATALGSIRDPLAAPALIDALRDPSPQVRERSALALYELGPGIADQLIKVLMDKDADVRINAARLLGEFEDAESVEPLSKAVTVDMADDNAWLFRVEVAKALGRIKDPQAIEILNLLLSDRVHYVRDMAEWAIKEISGKEIEKNQDSWWKKIF